MKGLAFIGGEAPGTEHCRFFASNADIIVAADSGLVAAENAGIRPHWIVGDMDSIDSLRRLEKYPDERILQFPEDKDHTDTEFALDLLWEKGCRTVLMAGGGGGRLDHLLAIRSLFERDRYPNRWVTMLDDVRCLNDGDEINMYLPLDSLISILPLGDGCWEIESSGLKWPLNNLKWNRGSVGISNRNISETFSLRIIRGRFMLILPLFNEEADVS